VAVARRGASLWALREKGRVEKACREQEEQTAGLEAPREHYGSLWSSTRRFCARPAVVVLEATGPLEP
jgi:hypothetical protein